MTQAQAHTIFGTNAVIMDISWRFTSKPGEILLLSVIYFAVYAY
jgi:hypothetical protein